MPCSPWSLLERPIFSGPSSLKPPQNPVPGKLIFDGGGSVRWIFKESRHIQLPWLCWNASARADGIVSVSLGKWWEWGEVSENWEKSSVSQKARRRIQETYTDYIDPWKGHNNEGIILEAISRYMKDKKVICSSKHGFMNFWINSPQEKLYFWWVADSLIWNLFPCVCLLDNSSALFVIVFIFCSYWHALFFNNWFCTGFNGF